MPAGKVGNALFFFPADVLLNDTALSAYASVRQ